MRNEFLLRQELGPGWGSGQEIGIFKMLVLYKSWLPFINKSLLFLSEKGELPSVSVKVSKKECFFFILWHTHTIILFEYALG